MGWALGIAKWAAFIVAVRAAIPGMTMQQEFVVFGGALLLVIITIYEYRPTPKGDEG